MNPTTNEFYAKLSKNQGKLQQSISSTLPEREDKIRFKLETT